MRTYVFFTDPSGGSNDSMTLAIAHRTASGLAVCDGLFEWRAPFSPREVARESCEIIKKYGGDSVTGDHYSGEWTREGHRENGVDYVLSERTKSEIFLEALALINSGRAKIPNDKRLRAQFLSLERRTARSGKDSIDHPPGGHDDLVNAVCGALVLAAAESSQEHVFLPEWISLRPGDAPQKPLPLDWATRAPVNEERLWRKLK